MVIFDLQRLFFQNFDNLVDLTVAILEINLLYELSLHYTLD